MKSKEKHTPEDEKEHEGPSALVPVDKLRQLVMQQAEQRVATFIAEPNQEMQLFLLLRKCSVEEKVIVFQIALKQLISGLEQRNLTRKQFNDKVKAITRMDGSIGPIGRRDYSVLIRSLEEMHDSEDAAEAAAGQKIMQNVSTHVMELLLDRADIEHCTVKRMSQYLRNAVFRIVRFALYSEEEQLNTAAALCGELDDILNVLLDRNEEEPGFLEDVVDLLDFSNDKYAHVHGREDNRGMLVKALQFLMHKGYASPKVFLAHLPHKMIRQLDLDEVNDADDDDPYDDRDYDYGFNISDVRDLENSADDEDW